MEELGATSMSCRWRGCTLMYFVRDFYLNLFLSVIVLFTVFEYST